MRWGIETSFRELKYSVTLLHLHSKKADFIYQEVFAKLAMYNFCQMITQSVVIQQGKKKHAYKVSFSDAVHVCLRFFRGKSVHPMLKPYLWGTSHLFALAECFLVSFPRNLRSASLIEYHNFLHLHSPFFADFFFRFLSVTLFCLRISTHNLFYWFCVLTFTVHF